MTVYVHGDDVFEITLGAFFTDFDDGHVARKFTFDVYRCDQTVCRYLDLRETSPDRMAGRLSAAMSTGSLDLYGVCEDGLLFVREFRDLRYVTQRDSQVSAVGNQRVLYGNRYSLPMSDHPAHPKFLRYVRTQMLRRIPERVAL